MYIVILEHKPPPCKVWVGGEEKRSSCFCYSLVVLTSQNCWPIHANTNAYHLQYYILLAKAYLNPEMSWFKYNDFIYKELIYDEFIYNKCKFFQKQWESTSPPSRMKPRKNPRLTLGFSSYGPVVI